MPRAPRIVLIQDDGAIRKLMRLTLVGFGYEVEEAADGKAGVDSSREEPADLVITMSSFAPLCALLTQDSDL